MPSILTHKFLILGLSLILLAAMLACGDKATPAPAPAQPTPDIGALVQGAVTAGLSQLPEGLDTKDIQAAIDSALATAATPVPTAAPVATAAPAAKVEPTGTLDLGIPGIDVARWVGRLQPYQATQFQVLTFGEAMFGWSPNNDLDPRLVTDWNLAIASDGTATYTFKLREGVPFSKQFGDWGYVTARDWIHTAQSVGADGSIHSQLGNARRMWLCDGCELTAPDDYTLVLKHPSGAWDIPSRWSGYPGGDAVPVSSKLHHDSVGEEQAARQPVGAGPWEVEEYNQDIKATLRAVRDHYRATPMWDQWIWWPIREESTRLANFEAGLLDTGSFSGDSIQAIKNLPDVEFLQLGAGIVHQLTILGQHYNSDFVSHVGESPRVPLADGAYDCTLAWVSCDRDITSAEWANARKVREAMNIAIDREAMINNLAFGQGRPVYTMHGTAYESQLSKYLDLDSFVYEFDPDKAKQLLVEAGFADGFDIQLRLSGAGSSAQIPPMKAAASMWGDIGIRVEQVDMPFGAFRPSLVNRSAKGIWNWSFGPSSLEPITTLGLIYNGWVGINAGVEHPYIQTGIDKASNELDPDARWAITADLIKFIRDESMGIPLYTEPVLWPLGPELGAWDLSGFPAQARLSNWEFAPHR